MGHHMLEWWQKSILTTPIADPECRVHNKGGQVLKTAWLQEISLRLERIVLHE